MEDCFSTTHGQMQEILDKREALCLYRSLQLNEGLIDFCSNDYLSFARSEKVSGDIHTSFGSQTYLTGATGSRSISGNSIYAEKLEKFLADFHKAEAGLLFNSGYDANLGLFSCIAQKDDVLICDELIHASIIDGCRLSYAKRFRFEHNSVSDLKKKLQLAKGRVFVAVESVYSMDGDIAPLEEIIAVCKQYNANLIVDEAHATGVFGEKGRGMVCALGAENDVFARVHTFGKAIGCHGAVVLGSEVLRNYLINFARSFIFTTALPVHSLISIRTVYEYLKSDSFDNIFLHKMIQQFKEGLSFSEDAFLIDSVSPIQSIVIPGNERAKSVSRKLQEKGFDVRAIVSPSVPVGKERLRISLHMHNTIEQVDQLKLLLQAII